MHSIFGHRSSGLPQWMRRAGRLPMNVVVSTAICVAVSVAVSTAAIGATLETPETPETPVAPAAPAAPSAPTQEISPAEVMVFQTNHMQNIHSPVDLTYAYKKAVVSAPGIDDLIHVDVTKINPDGTATVSLRFLTGTRKLAIPEVEHSKGNPLLLGFLEWDIAQMKALTGGSTGYFRRRIRIALAEAAVIRPTTITYKGKKLDAQEVSFQPYRNDPMHEKFEKYVDKRYTFVFSNKVPGGVYQIGTQLSTEKVGALTVSTVAQENMRTDETITLVKEDSKK
ncbi:hypothetical protein [Glaciimonas immobilis]|uniref:Uncharacterized protein n=1 Tax=Glaciimonas immobilis TaxID=728004 RepID=A0A840RXH2_9BURK|nr:hypothetical protein [Glaciimonas immobilis]KAF3998693.1 hypothetical protein HAV38_07565 [Glaciimonas immobilis]MBB5201566.1 hypothetical protein [Glaciimonas immobilis]